PTLPGTAPTDAGKAIRDVVEPGEGGRFAKLVGPRRGHLPTLRHLYDRQPGERPADEEISEGHSGVTSRKSPPIPIRNMANHAGRESQYNQEADARPVTWERGIRQEPRGHERTHNRSDELNRQGRARAGR